MANRVELRTEWYVAIAPLVVVTAIVVGLSWLGLHWTPRRAAIAIGIEAVLGVVAYVTVRRRTVADAAGILVVTWRSQRRIAWDDVARFHCDGTRLVMFGATGKPLFELSDEGKDLMQLAVETLRARGVLERRRDRLEMTEVQHHRLDWTHRSEPWLLVAAAVTCLVLYPLSPGSAIGALLCGAAALAVSTWNRRVIVTIGPDGILDRSRFSERSVLWSQVAAYRFEIEPISDWRLIDAGGVDEHLWSILILPFAFALNALFALFVVVGRGFARTCAYGIRSQRFYRGRLDLLDSNGNVLYSLAAKAGHADIEDAFDRILDELAERQVSFAA